MGEEHDSWFKQAFGVDLGQAVDSLKEEAKAVVNEVENKAVEVATEVKAAVEPRIDAALHGVSGAVKKISEAAGGMLPGGSSGSSGSAQGGPAGAFPLGGSVGRGGKNESDDVSAVQSALGLSADGKCGPQTISAIEAFQKTLGQGRPDGRVDPGGATEHALASGSKATTAPRPTADSSDSGGLMDRIEAGAGALLDRGKAIGGDIGAGAAQLGGEIVEGVQDDISAGAGAIKQLAGDLLNSGDAAAGGVPGQIGTLGSAAVADITAAGQPLAYEPGEREASFTSPGGVEKTASGFLLFNFGVNKTFIKPEHQKVLADLVTRFRLDDPSADTTIIKVSGFTDGVDVEPKNSPLRADRADAVQIFLGSRGALEENVGAAISTPAGTFLAPNTTRAGRSRNRAVLLELGSLVIDPVPDPVKPVETKSKRWALQSNLSVSAPAKPGVAVSSLNFILHDLQNNQKFLLQFSGFGAGLGIGFPASVALPSPTEFETTVPRDASEFNGGGAIRSGSVGLVIGFSIGEAQLHVSTKPPQIDIGGFQFSFGVEASFVGGTWKIIG